MKPRIIVSLQDMERLEALLDLLPSSASESKNALLDELGRADIVEADEIPSSVVTMNSKVRFEIEQSKEEFCLTLAYPRDTVDASDKISVLTPVGTALLGLSVGDHIDWPRRDGQMLRIRILEVASQPEHEGNHSE